MQNDDGFLALVFMATQMETQDITVYGNPQTDTRGYIRRARERLKLFYLAEHNRITNPKANE